MNYNRTSETNIKRNINTKDRKQYIKEYMKLYRVEKADKVKHLAEINAERQTFIRKYLAKYYKEHKEEILAEYDNYIKNKAVNK